MHLETFFIHCWVWDSKFFTVWVVRKWNVYSYLNTHIPQLSGSWSLYFIWFSLQNRIFWRKKMTWSVWLPNFSSISYFCTWDQKMLARKCSEEICSGTRQSQFTAENTFGRCISPQNPYFFRKGVWNNCNSVRMKMWPLTWETNLENYERPSYDLVTASRRRPRLRRWGRVHIRNSLYFSVETHHRYWVPSKSKKSRRN